jgi:hypothetical protein
VPLGALYGREVIADLELSAQRSDRKVEATALRHRIASRMTSMVAIAEEPTVDPRQPRRRETLPVEVPAFQSAETLGLRETHEAFMARVLAADPTSLGMRVLASRGRRVEAAPPRFLSRMGSWIGSAFSRLRGRVLRVDGELLVIEYASPEDGFLGPEASSFELSGTPEVSGTLDAGASSPRGPHSKGLLLRVAVRRSTGRWSAGDQVILVWRGRVEHAVEVEIPARTDAGDRV